MRINSPWTPNVDTACQRQNRFPSCGCCRQRRGGGERHVGPRSAHGLPWNPDLLTIWSHYLGRNLIPPHHSPPRPFPVLLSLKCWLVNLATGFGALFRACKHPLMGKLNILLSGSNSIWNQIIFKWLSLSASILSKCDLLHFFLISLYYQKIPKAMWELKSTTLSTNW